MGHFQLFSMILNVLLKFSMGHFLSFYTDFYGPFFQVNGTMAHGPLPSQSLCYRPYSSNESMISYRTFMLYVLFL